MQPWLFHLLLGSLGLLLTAAGAALVLRLWRQRPVPAYRLTVAILGAAVVLPLVQAAADAWGWPGEALALRRAERIAATESPRTGAPAALTPTEPIESDAPAPAARLQPEELPLDAPLLSAILAVAEHMRVEEEGARNWPGAQVVAGWLYLLGVALAAVHSLRRLARTRALLRAAQPERHPAVLAAWREVSAGSPLRDRVRLVLSPEVAVPACFGVLRPTIVLPTGGDLPDKPDVLRCALLHELVHLERRDTWVLLLREVFRCLFWFHPAAWWLRGKLDALRELSCDSVVVARIGGRKRYASVLLEYASLLSPRAAGTGERVALLPWTSSKSQLRRRIEMLIQTRSRKSLRASWTSLLGACALFTTVWGGQLALASCATPQEAAAAETAPEATLWRPPTAPDPAPAPLAEPAPEPAAPLGVGAAPAPPHAPWVGVGGEFGGMRPAAAPKRDWLGIRVDDVSPALAAQTGARVGEAMLITEVFPGSHAANAGVAQYDVLVAIDDGRVSRAALDAARQRLSDGGVVKLRVVRAGKVVELALGGAVDPRAGVYREVPPVTWEPFPQASRVDAWQRAFDAAKLRYQNIDDETLQHEMDRALQAYRDAVDSEITKGNFRAYQEQMQRDPARYAEAVRGYFNEATAEEFRAQAERFTGGRRPVYARPGQSAPAADNRDALTDEWMLKINQLLDAQQRQLDDIRAQLDAMTKNRQAAPTGTDWAR